MRRILLLGVLAASCAHAPRPDFGAVDEWSENTVLLPPGDKKLDALRIDVLEDNGLEGPPTQVHMTLVRGKKVAYDVSCAAVQATTARMACVLGAAGGGAEGRLELRREGERLAGQFTLEDTWSLRAAHRSGQPIPGALLISRGHDLTPLALVMLAPMTEAWAKPELDTDARRDVATLLLVLAGARGLLFAH